MKRISCILLLLLLISTLPGYAQHTGHSDSTDTHRSGYAGQETRSIKSLSEEDIRELSTGGGWGLAKAAELNGVPGPRHLLDMAEEIELSAGQREQITAFFDSMKADAVPLGHRLIRQEKALNEAFAAGEIDEERLREQLMKIARTTSELRYVHLSAHLKTIEVLTPRQVARYNQLRGYASADPCSNVPEGHDAEMWRRHNDCN